MHPSDWSHPLLNDIINEHLTPKGAMLVQKVLEKQLPKS
jgi:hypothetical protein